MHRSSRTVSLVATVVAAATLVSGCGGGGGSKPAAVDTSAAAAIAALSSKLAALTTTTPAAATPAASAAPTPAASAAAASTGGLPAVPSGAALSSLLATPASTAPAPAASNLGALASQANAAVGGALAVLDVTKYCNAVPHADIQALIKATVGAPVDFPLQCGWKGTDLKLSVNPNDDNVKAGSELIVGSDAKPLTGVGDTAKWDAPVPNATLPNVFAQKGAKFTCYVQAGDVPQSTVTYTGSDPFFKITDAAELAYATKEAKLCSDVFGVS
ncbi:hypothetical protein acdb102_40140 [Acidothermaceae bacterium B102]|nr:hypothetical protein acdb102_40140 [Acidothermaceae bacterium B102]